MNFDNKTAIVTGGSRGIGKAIAETLAQRGARVVIASRQPEQAEATAAELASATGQTVIALPVDVADPASVKALMDQVLTQFQRLDILVNNAGVTRDTLLVRMEESDWDLVLNINLKGAYHCSKAAIRQMMKQRSGRIINVTSVSGIAGQAGQTNYSASKAGLIGFTKALAREVGPRGITINAVAPGFVPTALTEVLPADLKEASLKAIPLGRWGTPQEIAAAVAFLASDEASYITGHVLSVDGGMVMG
jgi:3-oxoacyl-[acyl-carrier protein] reductase